MSELTDKSHAPGPQRRNESAAPPEEECDLAVIGGGPAGAAAAWQAARAGLRVVLLERDRLPRDKVCGEYLSAEALPLLEAMAPHLLAAAPRIDRAAFISPRGRRGEFRLPHAALGISRWQLDAALWAAAGAAGCTLRARHWVRSCRPAQPCATPAAGGAMNFALVGETLPAGASFTLRARAVVVAAGRWWRIAGLRAAPEPGRAAGSGWLGIKAHVRERACGGASPLSPPETNEAGSRLMAGRAVGFIPQPLAARAVEMYYFPGGYCGLAPVEGGVLNACCLLHAGAARQASAARDFIAWIRAVAASPALARRLAGCEQTTPTVVTAPVHLAVAPASQGGALLVGDAAGFIDPFTGAGMARALLGGALAGETVATALTTGEPLAAAAARYAAAVEQSSARPYRVARALRRLVLAPPWLQSSAGAVLALAPLAQQLVARTRWQPARG